MAKAGGVGFVGESSSPRPRRPSHSRRRPARFPMTTTTTTTIPNRWASWTLEHRSRIQRCYRASAAPRHTDSVCTPVAWRLTCGAESASGRRETTHWSRSVRCPPSQSCEIAVGCSERSAGRSGSRWTIGASIERCAASRAWFHRTMLNGPAWVLRDCFASSSMHPFEMSLMWCASRCSLRLEGQMCCVRVRGSGELGFRPRYTVLSLRRWLLSMVSLGRLRRTERLKTKSSSLAEVERNWPEAVWLEWRLLKVSCSKISRKVCCRDNDDDDISRALEIILRKINNGI